MVQEFIVLRCHNCELFQVHQSKKAAKWRCKVCNQNQTFKTFFGRGTGKECRSVVQKCNSLSGLKDEDYMRLLEAQNTVQEQLQRRDLTAEDQLEPGDDMPDLKRLKANHCQVSRFFGDDQSMARV